MLIALIAWAASPPASAAVSEATQSSSLAYKWCPNSSMVFLCARNV
jgi:hypothetical protein